MEANTDTPIDKTEAMPKDEKPVGGQRQLELVVRQQNLSWRVNTPGLLREILNNKGSEVLARPIQILSSLLADVGECAARINDAELNKLMLRLSIYSIADPSSPDFNQEATEQILSA